MAAGDLALSLLLTATDLASVVVADMATSYIGNTVAMTDSTAALNGYLATLDDQVFTTGVGFDGLAGSVDLTTVALADGDEAILSTMSATDVLTASLDATAASADASATSLAATATSADAAAVSLDAAGVSADAASGGFDILAVSEDAASAGLSALAAIAGAVVLALAAVVVVLTGIGVVSTKMAGDFQQATNLLITSAGETAQNIDMIRKGILKMSVDTATSWQDLTKGMFNVESAGYHGAAALQVLQAAAEGAKVENADLAAVTDVLTTAMHNYHMPASQAVDVMNSFRLAASIGKMRMDDLTGALTNVLPIASQAGVKLSDVEAALSTMSLAGDKGAIAGTHLMQMLTYLVAPSSKATAALQEVGLTTQQISDEMKVSLPGAVDMITQAVAEKFPVGSAKYIAALSAIVGGNKSMKAMLELSGQSLKTFTSDAQQLGPTMTANSKSVDGWNVVQTNFNFQMEAAKNAVIALFITIGTQLLPILTPLVKNIADGVAAFSAWLTKTGALQSAMSGLSGFLGGIGAAFHTVFDPVKQVAQAMKPLTDSFDHASAIIKPIPGIMKPLTDTFDRASSVIGKTNTAVHNSQSPWQTFFGVVKNVWDALRKIDWGAVWAALQNIGTAIKNVNWGAVWAAMQAIGTAIKNVNWAAVWAAMQNIGKAISTVATALSKVDWGGIFATIGGAIKNVSTTLSKVDWGKVFSTVGTALQGIGNFLKSTFMPVWDQLVQSFKDIQAALKPVMPQLQQFGQSLAIGVGLAIILVISILAGLISAFANVLTGVAIFVTGVVQFFSGLYQFFTSVMQLISDLLSGHWERIAADLNGIMWGIVNMFLGAWNMIKGLWVAAGGFIFAFADGFSKAIVGIFTGLWDMLVGHSIIPDMVNGIINWFLQLGPRGLAAIGTLIDGAKKALGDFATAAVQLGSNIVKGIANGISGAFGFIGDQMHRLTGFIGSFLPHSPAEQGELSHLNEYGPSFVKGFADGITRSHPMMHTALSGLTSIMAAPGSFAAGSASGGNAFALSGGQTIMVQVQPQKQDIYLDRKKVGEGVMQYAQQEIRISGNVRR